MAAYGQPPDRPAHRGQTELIKAQRCPVWTTSTANGWKRQPRDMVQSNEMLWSEQQAQGCV